ncbi:MAG TPA: succinylglutamate desuccinylase/aspartoacylase family protein [Alphaproteobacteria bacterium]|nr:succinylglutamate desuccinylase/aspartoacylase family protein [Alphaproteobacteria bacterium]
MKFENPGIPGAVRITTGNEGPHVALFGGIHGDEVSGVHAIEKLLFDFFGGARALKRGRLTLVRGNELALAADRRYVKHNLNRLFRKDYGAAVDKASYEFARAQQLKTILENCDYFLDLHSAPIAQEPFMVAEQSVADFFARLGVPRIITGWSKFSSGAIGGDAENYASAHHAKSATLESGSHYEKRSIDVAYGAATALLSLLGLIAKTHEPPAKQAEIIDMYAVLTKDFDDFRFTDAVENFQFLKKGDIFAHQNGRPLAVLEDSYLLIPMIPDQTKIGEEICYLGRKLAAA